VFYYFADHLGTSREIVQAGQTSFCYDADFYPFGGERIYTNTCPQNYKFTGKERDSESGLDDFGARYHSSSMGRFMSADWSETPQSVPYVDFGDPQSLNLYTYSRNRPLTYVDRDGHCIFGLDTAVCAVVVAAVVVGGIAWTLHKLTEKTTEGFDLGLGAAKARAESQEAAAKGDPEKAEQKDAESIEDAKKAVGKAAEAIGEGIQLPGRAWGEISALECRTPWQVSQPALLWTPRNGN